MTNSCMSTELKHEIQGKTYDSWSSNDIKVQIENNTNTYFYIFNSQVKTTARLEKQGLQKAGI